MPIPMGPVPQIGSLRWPSPAPFPARTRTPKVQPGAWRGACCSRMGGGRDCERAPAGPCAVGWLLYGRQLRAAGALRTAGTREGVAGNEAQSEAGRAGLALPADAVLGDADHTGHRCACRHWGMGRVLSE